MLKTKKKKNSSQRRKIAEKNSILTTNQKKNIFGILLILISLLIFLSIVSYSKLDRANLSYRFSDILKIFSSNSEVAYKLDSTRNLLGVLGAYISDFFLNSTLGVFSTIFPIMFFILGISLFKKIENKNIFHTFNFLVLFALIASTIFGVFRMRYSFFGGTSELSGAIGDYIGVVLSRLLGGVGSLLFLTASFLILILVEFDISLKKIFSFFKRKSKHLLTKDELIQEISIDKKTEDNLEKIKKLGKEKPVKKKLFGRKKEEEKEPKIRIIRKNDEPTPVVKSEMLKGQSKKTDLKKPKAVPSPISIEEKERQAELPDPWEEKINYTPLPLDILNPIPPDNITVAEEELTHNAELLKEKLRLFDIEIEDISVTPGPVVTLFEIVPAPGVKISRIVGLEHDIALALAARGIRIIAPIPGKSAIGVEIPNAVASLVNARSVLSKIYESKAELPIAMGKMINGDVFIADLTKMPHILIAGSTGSGKSVGINMIIASLLYSKSPSQVKLLLIDPKKIELSFYNKLRKHFLAVSPDLDEEIITNPQNAILLLKSVEYEMEKRYDKLAKAGVRNLVDYNTKVMNPKTKPADTDDMKHHFLPYLVVIIDELADLMITAGKEVEEPIARLAQLARAVGIHLVVATQRPSVNVITGVIKANFSARIAYQVATKIDSRTILDMNGAEQLLGKGDVLFLPTGLPKPIRMQNAFISTEEVEKITEYVESQPGYSKPYFLPSLYDKKKQAASGFLSDLDPMFDEAARVIVRHQQGSVSLLQRRLKLGYSRAARIVDQLEEAGIVGASDGSKARTVLVENEEQLETIIRSL